MPKILIINSTLERGGITTVMLNLSKGLLNLGIEPLILTLSKEPKESALLEFETLGIKIICLELSGFQKYFFYGSKLKKAVAAISPDIIQTFSYRGTWYSFKYLKEINRVATLEADVFANYITIYGKVIGSILAKRELKGWRNSSMPVACSRSLGKFSGSNQVEIIYNGSDADRFKPVDTLEKNRFRESLGVPENAKVIVSTSALIERKNPALLLHALERLPEHYFLIFVGSGTLEEKLKEQGRHLSERFLMFGNQQNVLPFLQCADIFISASRSEGFPNSVVEAGLCGIGLILSNIEPHIEISEVMDDRVMLFETDNLNSLVECISTWKLPNLGPSENPLSHKVMAEKYLKIYTNLASS